MECNADYLMENMTLQLEMHRSLLSLLENKTRAFIEHDVRGLEAMLGEEESLLGQIRRLMDVRSSVMTTCAERLGLCSETTALSQIGSTLDEEKRKAFDDAVKYLSETAQEFVDLDTLNLNLARPSRGRRKKAEKRAEPVLVPSPGGGGTRAHAVVDPGSMAMTILIVPEAEETPEE